MSKFAIRQWGEYLEFPFYVSKLKWGGMGERFEQTSRNFYLRCNCCTRISRSGSRP